MPVKHQSAVDPYAALPDTSGAQRDPYASLPNTAVPDFSAGPKNTEGLYQMMRPDGTPVDVPYSKVMAASAAGWKITPKARETYAKDRFATLQAPAGQPRISRTTVTNPLEGRFTKGGRMVPQPPLPEETEAPPPGLWEKMRTAFAKVAAPTGANRPTSLAQTHSLVDTAWNWGANLADETGNILGTAANTAFGAADMIPQIYSASKDFLTSYQPDRAASGAARLLQMLPPQMAQDYMQRLKEEQAKNPKYAADDVIGTALGIWAAGKATEVPGEVVKGLPALRQAVAARYGPRPVELAGEKIPVAVGEAEPASAAGRMQARLKRSGTDAAKFEKLEAAQQEAVKQVIRRTAQQTAGLTEPVAAEPGAAMQDAADATFSKARPMYAALDKSLVTVPDGLQNVSQITQQAIARAEKLGVDVSDSGITGEYYVDKAGNPVDRGSMSPAKFDDAIRNGDITTKQLAQGQPISTYMKVRSQLLKMKRATADAATRNAISNEISRMNDNMEAALKGTPLYENWLEANRLWLKGYALRDVANALKDVTKGTPAAQQAPGLAPVPTRLQGAGLVDRLNTLADEGTLDKAFTPEEVRNLRQSADILDRIQRTPVGKGYGENMSRARGLTHAISGAAGPIAGAGIGFALGHGLYGAEAGAGIGFLVQAVGERALVHIMTRVNGVNALKTIEAAKTPAQLQSAMKTLATLAAASSAARQQTKSLKELREEAQKHKPAAPLGPQSFAPGVTHYFDEGSERIVPV